VSTKGTLEYLDDSSLAGIDCSQEEHGIVHDAHTLKLANLFEEAEPDLEYDKVYTEIEYGQPWQMDWEASPPEFMPDSSRVELVGEMDVVLVDTEGADLYYFEVKKESEKNESKARKQLSRAKQTIEEYDVHGNFFYNRVIESMDTDWIEWYLEPGFVKEADLYIP
jgi:hypothetical protein